MEQTFLEMTEQANLENHTQLRILLFRKPSSG